MICRHCGSPNADDAAVCARCGESLTSESQGMDEKGRTPRDAPSTPTPGLPQDPLPLLPNGSPAGHGPVGMGDRLLAVLLDTLLGVAFFAFVGMWYAAGREGLTEGGFSLTGAPALFVLLVCMGAGFLYYWLLEGWTGMTLGKAMVGVRVMMKNGTRPDMKASLVRNLLRIVDIIGVYLVGFLVAILSKRRQRIGDHVAGTVVVEASPKRILRAAAAFLWLALMVSGGLGAVWMHRHATPLSAAESGAAVPPAAPEGGFASVTPEAGEVEEGIPAADQQQEEWSVFSTGEMEITHFAFLEKEDGPPRERAPYAPGDKIFIEYSVSGFERDEDSRINMGLEALTRDSNGVPLHEPWSQTLAQRSDGTPLTGSYSATIPLFAPAGIYEFKLNIGDEMSGTELVLTAHLLVEADPIEPASHFEIRDFILSLTEGGEGADPPILEGGGTVYMRCKLFGIQLQDDVAEIQVEFQVKDPGGEVLFDEPEYYRDRDTYVYHPPTFYLPIYGHLTIPQGMPEGTYTLRYTARDNLTGEEIVKVGTVEVR